MLSFFQTLNHYLWGLPLIFLLLFTHLYFTCRLSFVQRYIKQALKFTIRAEDTSDSKKEGGEKGFSSFGALATTLAATLGTGNIIGVSTAIALGGPGAAFWCWITGIFGMATSYAESYLSMLFRRKDENGNYFGGPMYVLDDGLHKKGLAAFYAFCVVIASFGVGCTTQSNSLADTMQYLFQVSPTVTGIITAVVIGFVLLSGAKGIEKWCMKLVPFMGILYMAACIVILGINVSYILPSISMILESALSVSSFAAGLLGSAIRYGIARGLFTNEAGLGSAAIAAAGSRTAHAGRQALVSMSATFLDTVIMCAVTALVIISNLLHFPESIKGKGIGSLTHAAFEALPFGSYLIGICLILFAFATLIGWSYFGTQAFLYLFPKKHLKTYQIMYLIMIFLGAILSLHLVWEITDTLNVFMAIPNLISLFLLRKLILPYKAPSSDGK